MIDSARTPFLLLLLLVIPGLGACGDDPVEPEPEPTVDLTQARVGYVDMATAVPRLMAKNLGLAEPVAMSFEGARDRIDGNTPSSLVDNNLIYMARPRWSPDGQKLAVIVGTADGLSRIVVVNVADTTEVPQVASINTGTIVAYDWHPGSNRLAWAMESEGAAVDLYTTDLEFHLVKQITDTGTLVKPRVRWSTEGDAILASSIEYTVDDGTLVMPYTRLDRYDTIAGNPTEVTADVPGLTHDLDRAGSFMLMTLPQAWNDVERRYTSRPLTYFIPTETTSFLGTPGVYEFVRYAGAETRLVWAERVGSDEVGGLELTIRDNSLEPPQTWALNGTERLKGLGDYYVP